MRPLALFLMALPLVLLSRPVDAQTQSFVPGPPGVQGYYVPAPAPVRVPVGVAPGYPAAGPYRYSIQPGARTVPSYRYGGWPYAPPRSNFYSGPRRNLFGPPWGVGSSGALPSGAFPPPMIGG